MGSEYPWACGFGIVIFYSSMHCDVCKEQPNFLVVLVCPGDGTYFLRIIFLALLEVGPGRSVSSCLLELPRSELAQVYFFSLAYLSGPGRSWPRSTFFRLLAWSGPGLTWPSWRGKLCRPEIWCSFRGRAGHFFVFFLYPIFYHLFFFLLFVFWFFPMNIF